MTGPQRIKHEFVEFVPNQLAANTLYISGTYATCSHLCLCGCGHKVVTPLAPNEWRLHFDGETVSLSPSIGNWSFDCQSHYWIEESRVVWARRWSREKIDANRARDRRQKQRWDIEREPRPVEDESVQSAIEPGWLRRVFRRLSP